MKLAHWIIEGGKVRKGSFAEWGAFMGCADRRVARTKLGKYLVSTVFLGIDHGFNSPRPILFETMVFSSHTPPDKKWDHQQRRYGSIAAALSGHREMVLELMNEHLRLEPEHETCQVGFVPENKRVEYANIVARIERQEKDLPDFLK
jgi:hypothetical protein